MVKGRGRDRGIHELRNKTKHSPSVWGQSLKTSWSQTNIFDVERDSTMMMEVAEPSDWCWLAGRLTSKGTALPLKIAGPGGRQANAVE